MSAVLNRIIEQIAGHALGGIFDPLIRPLICDPPEVLLPEDVQIKNLPLKNKKNKQSEIIFRWDEKLVLKIQVFIECGGLRAFVKFENHSDDITSVKFSDFQINSKPQYQYLNIDNIIAVTTFFPTEGQNNFIKLIKPDDIIIIKKKSSGYFDLSIYQSLYGINKNDFRIGVSFQNIKLGNKILRTQKVYLKRQP